MISPNHPVSGQRKIGILLAVLGTVLFSFKSIVIKLAYQYEIDAYQVIALRMLFSAPIYLIILAFLCWRKPIPLQTLNTNKWTILASGVLGYYLASLLDLKGLELISAQLERLILYTYPGFVMLFSWLVWRTMPGKNTIFALIATWLGIFTVLGVEIQNNMLDVLWGGTLVLISAAAFGGYLILSKSGIAKLGSQQFTCFAMLVASICVGGHLSLIGDVTISGLPWPVYGHVLILALVCTVIPSLLIAAAISRIGPQQTSILGGLGPIMTALSAVYLLQEPFGLAHLLGTGLVMLGVYLVATEKKVT
ncbi:DMT family transporter [Planctobacterium marinum]|uniref:Permease n=1 Tax=Planctobacterium marinum TaxID=1631968 RepID=A0AA48HXV1_9ALTE|nr:permease [Planctobacterium marinum]